MSGFSFITSGVTALYMEFYKCRRRKMWLAPLLMLVFQMMWGMACLKDDNPLEGWQDILYSFPLLNAMMFPIIAAAIASRIADIEHKGQTFKLLETMQTAGQLFDAKYLCAAWYVLLTVTWQVVIMLVSGVTFGFYGMPLATHVVFYYLATLLTTLAILLMQFILSLLTANQMIGMILGLIGAFVGLFSLFLPPSFQSFLIWAYYGVLQNVGMDWNRELRTVHYYYTPCNWVGLGILCGIFIVLYLLGRHLFTRKEV